MHRIQLNGPWEFCPLAASSPPTSPANSSSTAGDPTALPPSGTVKLPCEWQGFLGDFRGTVRLTRRFNRPTNLDPHEVVELVLESLHDDAHVVLNEVILGELPSGAETRFDITPHLQPFNTLALTLVWQGTSSPRGGLVAPVALEIR